MKLTEIDLEPEDIYQYNCPDKVHVTLSAEDVKLSYETPIVIKYDYLDLGSTAYHFKQIFEERDTQAYFEKMKMISSETINNLSKRAAELHFRRSDIKGNLYKALKTLFADKDIDPCLIIFHFALYSDKDVMACRETNIRCPRVYFMLGTNGFIYPLFFDPYHELNPLV